MRAPAPANSIAVTCSLVALLSSVAVGQDSAPYSDEAAMASLVRRAAAESAAHMGAGDISFSVLPAASHPMVAQLFAEELMARGAVVSLEGRTRGRQLSVDVRELRISTASLTDSSYFRRSAASIGVLGVDNSTGAVLISREFNMTRNDTLAGAPRKTGIDFLQTEAPGFWDAVAAPIIAAAAAAVIVVLLFTVRGS